MSVNMSKHIKLMSNDCFFFRSSFSISSFPLQLFARNFAFFFCLPSFSPSDVFDHRAIALLSGSDLINDPFVPMRGRRFDNKAIKDAFIAMHGRKLNEWNDPFVPMRGRKFDQNAWDDPFIPMRGRRRNDKSNEPPVREQRSKPIPADLYLNDPFIPMRGRRQVNDNDTFVPQRGRRSILAQPQQQQQQLQQQHRSKGKSLAARRICFLR